MAESIQNELSDIRNAVSGAVEVKEIYLFGSYVYGTPCAESDFDIYVVISDGTLWELDAMTKIGAALYKIQKHPIDVLALRDSVFSRRKTMLTLERTVFEKGVRLYG